MLIQLDFLQDDPMDQIRTELRNTREMADKVRKGIFARHNELAKLFVELDNRLNVIEMFICKGNYHG